MRKQRVFMLVFVILALGISMAVYFGARADVQNRRQRELAEWERRRQGLDPFRNLPLQPGARPEQPALPPASPTGHVQGVLQTIEDVQRINRLNREMQGRAKSPAAPPSSQNPAAIQGAEKNIQGIHEVNEKEKQKKSGPPANP